MSRRRFAVAALAAILVAALLPAGTSAGTTVTGTPLALLKRLAIASERRTGYDRDRFPHWIDADGDRCDTRAEVMIAESTRPVRVSSSCWVSGGRWYSAYDGIVTTVWGDIDIDHVVALAEAWDSGAWAWTTSRRQAYANDLGDPRTLRGVTDNLNLSKGDRDPAEWLPPLASFRCRYLSDWIVVKVRWKLAVDRAERTRIASLLEGCPSPTLRVTIV